MAVVGKTPLALFLTGGVIALAGLVLNFTTDRSYIALPGMTINLSPFLGRIIFLVIGFAVMASAFRSI